MKILHTADWHLGKRLDRFERMEEQRAVMDELVALADAESADVVIVAGDLFDQFNPSAEATELFYRTLARLSGLGRRAVVAIAGNHDSPERIEAPHALARECGILFAGWPGTSIAPFRLDTGLEVLRSAPGFAELKLPACSAPLRLALTPFANELRLRRYLGRENRETELRRALAEIWSATAEQFFDSAGVNLIAAHLLFMNEGDPEPVEPEDEKPVLIGGASAIYTSDLPAQAQYTALGHLHSCFNLRRDGAPVVYSGSPLAYSFDEAGAVKHVVIIEAEPGQPVRWKPVPLHSGKPLYRVEHDSVDAAIAWLNEHQDGYTELTLILDSYLSGPDRRRVTEAHPLLVGPVPRLRTEMKAGNREAVDLSLGTEALFQKYFESKKGVPPGDRMMEIFREVLAAEDLS